MAHILEHIYQRRSIRKFTEEQVSQENVIQILKAGMAAPSATNRQPWEFVAVTDRKVLEGLRRILVLGRYHAPIAIVVCGNMKRALPGPAQSFWIQDCSAATENILLAATGLGLGAVWVGVHPIGLLAKGVSRTIRLPKYVIPLGVIYLGYPAETKASRTQYDQRKVHWQYYGNNAVEESTPT